MLNSFNLKCCGPTFSQISFFHEQVQNISRKLHSIRGKVLGKLVVLLAACMSLLWNEPLNCVVGSTSKQFVIVIVIDNINVNNINIDITNYCYCYWNEPLNGVVGSSRQFVILHSTFVPSFAESGRPLLLGNKLLIGFWLETRQFQSGHFSQALSIELVVYLYTLLHW